jgi:hypothetical protein
VQHSSTPKPRAPQNLPLSVRVKGRGHAQSRAEVHLKLQSSAGRIPPSYCNEHFLIQSDCRPNQGHVINYNAASGDETQVKEHITEQSKIL